jgi:hypothetical protein
MSEFGREVILTLMGIIVVALFVFAAWSVFRFGQEGMIVVPFAFVGLGIYALTEGRP